MRRAGPANPAIVGAIGNLAALQRLLRIHRRVDAMPWRSARDLRYHQCVEDRRAAPRQEAYISAALETSQGRTTIAITRDISARGLLLLTRLPLEVGEIVKLTAAVGDEQHALSGKVVRVEALEVHELWRHKAAITVDEDDLALAALHAALTAEQAKS